MSTGKAKPTGAGRPGLATTVEVRAWREQLTSERAVAAADVKKRIETIGDVLYEPNSYFKAFAVAGESPKRAAQFTLDRMADISEFDPRTKKDTLNPAYARRLRGLKTAHVMLTNQTYGAGKKLEDPKSYGFARTALLQDSIYDHGHI
jgi:hypothetical protein